MVLQQGIWQCKWVLSSLSLLGITYVELSTCSIVTTGNIIRLHIKNSSYSHALYVLLVQLNSRMSRLISVQISLNSKVKLWPWVESLPCLVSFMGRRLCMPLSEVTQPIFLLIRLQKREVCHVWLFNLSYLDSQSQCSPWFTLSAEVLILFIIASSLVWKTCRLQTLAMWLNMTG